MRIGRAAVVDAGHCGIVIARIAGAEARATGLPLQCPAARANPPIGIARAAGPEAESVDHPLALQWIVDPTGRELWIGANAVECAVQRLWQLSFDDEVGIVAFEPDRLERAGQEGTWGIGLGHRALLIRKACQRKQKSCLGRLVFDPALSRTPANGRLADYFLIFPAHR